MINNLNSRENAKIIFTLTNIFIYELIFLFVISTGYQYYFVYYLKGYAIFLALYFVLYTIFSKLFDSYELGETTTTDLFLSYSLSLLMNNGFIYVIICLVTFHFINPIPMIVLQVVEMAISAVLLKCENSFIRSHYSPTNVAVIYGEERSDLIGKLNNVKDLSLSVVKTYEISSIDLDNLDKIFDNIDGVVTIEVHHENKKKIFKRCYEKGMVVYDVPSITDMLLASSNILHMVDTPILKTNKFGPSEMEKLIKRFIDIVGSLVLLVLASPFMLLTTVAIKIEDGGDIFYRQIRLTENKKEFGIIKFRSMIMNAESNTGAVLAKQNDDRITKVGKFIRKTRIDELPQLLNILKGDMSFVGPRPERPEIFKEIIKDMPEFEYRLVVKAGLTGYAQVYGKYNTRLRDKLLMDLYYIENYSVVQDIKLLLLTIKIVFKKDAAEGVE